MAASGLVDQSSLPVEIESREVQILISYNSFCNTDIRSTRLKVFAAWMRISYRAQTMKQKLWLPLVTCLAYCIDKELYKAIDYLREQVRVLVPFNPSTRFGRFELGITKSSPHWLNGFKGMSQINVFRIFEDIPINIPKAREGVIGRRRTSYNTHHG